MGRREAEGDIGHCLNFLMLDWAQGDLVNLARYSLVLNSCINLRNQLGVLIQNRDFERGSHLNNERVLKLAENDCCLSLVSCWVLLALVHELYSTKSVIDVCVESLLHSKDTPAPEQAEVAKLAGLEIFNWHCYHDNAPILDCHWRCELDLEIRKIAHNMAVGVYTTNCGIHFSRRAGLERDSRCVNRTLNLNVLYVWSVESAECSDLKLYRGHA